MTQEQEFFLSVLADHLHNRKTNPPEELDWQQLMTYATQHQLMGVLWHQCKTFLLAHEQFDDISKRLRLISLSDLASYANNYHAYQELKSQLFTNQIPYFSVKGLDIATLYPIPGYRTMGDIDIIIPKEKKDRVKEIMTRLGYQIVKQDYELVFARNSVTIEIHDSLVYQENQEKSVIKRHFDNCWKYICINGQGEPVLDWNFHFIFLIEHTKKHFSGNGIGFRQFMDIAVVATTVKSLNWNTIEKDLRRIGLWTFTLRTLEFCKRCFGIELPIETTELDNDFYEKSTELVFSNGVFGFNNPHHEQHAIDRHLRASMLPRTLSKFMMVLKDVFIPYKYMIALPYCAFLKGKRILLPYAWFYRVFYVLANKRDLVASKRKLLFDSDDVILYHNQLMREWGL